MSGNRRLAALLALVGACGGKKDGPQPGGEGGAAAPEAPEAPDRVSRVQVSRPRDTTVAAVKAMKGELAAVTFLPEGDLRDQVHGYLTDLAAKSGKPIAIRELDRLVDVAEAQRHKVVRDDTVVLSSGERSHRISLGPRALVDGAVELPRLDDDVAEAVARVSVTPRTAVLLTLGIADPATPPKHRVVEQVMSSLGIRVERLAPDAPAPADAGVLVLLDDGTRPLDAALERVDKHVAAGGSALVAIEPVAETSLGPLGARLGLRLVAESVADDKNFLRRQQIDADHLFVITNAFASHPTTAVMSRGATNAAALFPTTGSLEVVAGGAARPLVIVHTTSSAFRDLDHDYRFDPDEEERGELPIAAAVELAAAAGPTARGPRVLVVADADWASDEVLTAVRSNQGLLIDGLRWLEGEADLQEARDTRKAAPVELTRYPLRPRGGPVLGEPAPLWDEKPEAITAVTLLEGSRTVSVTRKEGYLWGREHRPAVSASPREFPVDDEAERLLVVLARPRSLRALGRPDAARLAELGLEPAASRVTVVAGGRTHELVLGGRVYGGADRYALDPATGEAHVIPFSALQPLVGGESALRLRRLLGVDRAEVTRVAVDLGGGSRRTLDLPADDGAAEPGSPAAIAGLVVARAQQLIAVEYLGEAGPPAGPAPRSIATLTFTTGAGDVPLELLAADAADGTRTYYVRTPRTHGLARVSTASAEPLARIATQAAATP